MDKLKVDEKLEHMKKRKLRISSIEIMAILGLIIWLLTIFLRKYYSINSVVPIFMSHPSFGGAWIATAMLKQPFSPTFSTNKVSTIEFSKKTLMYICIVFVLMSFINELLPLINTSAVFDVYDVLATVLAEIIAFSIPVILKEKTLIDYR